MQIVVCGMWMCVIKCSPKEGQQGVQVRVVADPTSAYWICIFVRI